MSSNPTWRGSSGRKLKWSADEDKLLISAVKIFGTTSWIQVAAMVPGRTGKQCRERWIGQLSPFNSHQNWTPEEDRQLLDLRRVHSNHWTKIATFLPGRSAISVKNRWNWLARHLAKNKDEDSISNEDDVVEVPQKTKVIFDPITTNSALFGEEFAIFQEKMFTGSAFQK